jgi:hypothetical protein
MKCLLKGGLDVDEYELVLWLSFRTEIYRLELNHESNQTDQVKLNLSVCAASKLLILSANG